MNKRVAITVLLLAVASGAGLWLWRQRQPPPAPKPDRLLFEQVLPGWITARARRDLPGLERDRALDLAKAWPEVEEALRAVDQSWPDVAKTKQAVAGLNSAARAAGLAYWVDVITWRETPYLLTYEVLSRSRWRLRDAEKDLLRVRRLDHVNVELGYLGHAGGDTPVVLVDRLEPAVLSTLQMAFAEEPEGNAVNRAALVRWRTALQSRAGAAALAEAAAQVRRREELFGSMRGRLREGAVLVEHPESIEWGEEFFERLAPATDTRRRGGPLLLASDVRDLKWADRALRKGEGRRALDLALELEALATEAHEARHALDPEPLPVPEPLLLAAGEDDLEFAEAAERELRAYLGQLHDAAAPPCITVVRLAVQTAGERARETPHHFAGMILLETMSPTGAQGLPALVEELCSLPEEEVRRRAAVVFKSLYGRPFEPATRVASEVQSAMPAAVVDGEDSKR